MWFDRERTLQIIASVLLLPSPLHRLNAENPWVQHHYCACAAMGEPSANNNPMRGEVLHATCVIRAKACMILSHD
jgi:hypothetical protein